MTEKRIDMKEANDLYHEVSKWVDTFNFIQVSVLEKACGNMLFENIRQSEINFDNVAEFSNKTSKQLKKLYKKVEDCPEYDDCRDQAEGDNYPMWNTCFEFKQNESEDVIKAAQEAGFGIIEGLDDFNQILFVRGCGYSFYGAHWIPLYLHLPWNKSELEKHKDLDYSMV